MGNLQTIFNSNTNSVTILYYLIKAIPKLLKLKI